MTTKPSVLFVCVHNAGRSQMAAGFLRHLGGDRIEVRSAGSMPADQINPVAVEAMAEVGVDIAGEQPKVLTTDAVQASDVVITMGCGDACPYYPGKRYEDWVLEDPAGQGIDSVRPIRDEIRSRVEAAHRRTARLISPPAATGTRPAPRTGRAGRVGASPMTPAPSRSTPGESCTPRPGRPAPDRRTGRCAAGGPRRRRVRG